jgi:hypothetical protein
MHGGPVVRFAVIDSDVIPTGATEHYFGMPGGPRTEMAPFAALAISQSDDSYYLCYLDEDWDYVTDTWHQSLDDALHQAELEFQGIGDKWQAVE